MDASFDTDPDTAEVIAKGEDLLDRAHAVAATIVGRVYRTVGVDDPSGAALAALGENLEGADAPSCTEETPPGCAV
jgi:hypothetical protein